MTTLMIAADQADESSALMVLVAFMLGSGLAGSIIGIGSYEMLARLAATQSKYARLLALFCYFLAVILVLTGAVATVVSALTGHFDNRSYLAIGGWGLGGLAYAINKHSSGQSDRHDMERTRQLAIADAELDAEASRRKKLAEARKAEIENEKEELALERAKLELELKRRELGLGEPPEETDLS
ncbi:hypothetical protein D2E40_23270 [Mycobacteroides abscessus]|uniref:hypothetical protein n=1 Tax=Mycobacteroides abscessus TaxID=36809 RepID=UPI000E6936C5|nr:hypothetical protein [Mycobacteroides abscessus]RIQ93444.1 hypothetical protein D2E40_23270 [Mycobacteroides abscessus]